MFDNLNNYDSDQDNYGLAAQMRRQTILRVSGFLARKIIARCLGVRTFASKPDSDANEAMRSAVLCPNGLDINMVKLFVFIADFRTSLRMYGCHSLIAL